MPLNSLMPRLTAAPQAFVDYVASGGAMRGQLHGDPGHFELWSLDDLAELNEHYGIDDHLPGFLAFGTDGDQELLAFDGTEAVYMVPAVGMDADAAHLVADDWQTFQQMMV